MFIHKDKCLELGLPEPYSYEKQINYVVRLMTQGHNINTRIARYIGIHNLHSIVSTLKNKGFKFTLRHGLVKCPFLGTTPPQPVDIAYMTPEQIINYKKEKAAKNLIKATL